MQRSGRWGRASQGTTVQRRCTWPSLGSIEWSSTLQSTPIRFLLNDCSGGREHTFLMTLGMFVRDHVLDLVGLTDKQLGKARMADRDMQVVDGRPWVA